MLICEDHVNATKGYGLGKSSPYEAFTDDTGELFRHGQQEFGKCVSSVYVDTGGKKRRIGWVFQKSRRYEDTGERYIHEVWVTLYDAPPTQLRHYHHLAP